MPEVCGPSTETARPSRAAAIGPPAGTLRAVYAVRNPAPWWFWGAIGLGATTLAGVGLYAWRQSRRVPPLADEQEQLPEGLAWADNPYGFGWESKDGELGLGQQTEGGLPLSDQMVLNANCSGPQVKVVKWRYDIRLTNYFWHWWKKGMRDPVLLTMKVLELDSSHCAWPPDVDASEWADIIWDGTLQAVTTYVDLIESGRLAEFSWDPMEIHSKVKPLVVWAS